MQIRPRIQAASAAAKGSWAYADQWARFEGWCRARGADDPTAAPSVRAVVSIVR